MANFLSLLNEMRMCIYVCSSRIGSAVSLHSVSRGLRSVWLKHNNHIAEAALRRQIPAYQDAVDLAILEAPLIDQTRLFLPTTNQVPVCLYLSRLLRNNAGLASSATAA